MKTLKICAVLIVLLLALIVVHLWFGGGKTPEASTQNSSEPAAPDAQQVAQTAETPAPVAPPPPPPPPVPTADEVRDKFQDYFNGNVELKDDQGFSHSVSAAQYWFDQLHPVGTAKHLDVNDLVLNKDDNGAIQSVGLELILYWQGPLQEGSTTFKMLYDVQSDEFSHLEVERTDGVTRDDLNDFAKGYQLGAQIHDALSGNQ